jgi:hypothetical protein
MTPAERTERRIAQPNFWNRQGEKTLDRATAMMPKLLYERLDEIGSDFAVIYRTAGLGPPRIKDDETRRAVIRAYNVVSADYFRDFSDRMTPGGDHPDAQMRLVHRHRPKATRNRWPVHRNRALIAPV